MLQELSRKVQRLYVPTSNLLLLTAQTKLLGHFCGNHVDIESARSLGGINYIVVRAKRNKISPSSSTSKTLLLVHGFGSGLGFFFANYAWLSASYDEIYSVDLLGMGGSDRLPVENSPRVHTSQLLYKFFTGNNAAVDENVIPRATDFFVDSLERFANDLKLPEKNLHVAGHSLGSYLTWNYAMKHKQRVEALVMISPCGVPKSPPQSSRLVWNEASLSLTLIRFLWENNVTPQQLIRISGSRGMPMITSVLNRRFNSRWDEQELQLIGNYFYHITAAPASGEYTLNSLLQPVLYREGGEVDGAVTASIFAKRSIEEDIDCSGDKSAPPFPILLLFGDHDWLRFKGVEKFVQKCADKGVALDYSLIKNAGHHLYLDNTDEFHDAIRAFRLKHRI